ncbi:lymphocyte antigen 75-like [Denticeps clupeoides]|uniref:lymphocyte antigen 75-like n=1 Tax=Denticeps clupeoides TaxID=299321 RepID=UPI0010A32333|nr:lymphocyte antigen 75-like [Denticeps clupeoides]
MAWSTFLALLLAGSCGSAVCLREYHFVPQLMTWGDAQAFCRQEYTDLVALHGAEDVQLLLSTADYAGSAWIGLYNDWNVWRWSFNDNKSVPYLNWNSGEPNGVMELCVIMYTSGKWNDYGCFILSPFACYDEGAPDPYVMVNEAMNWTEAQAYCRAYYTDLVSVMDQAENQKIQRKVTSTIWTGMFRDGWKWSDQSDRGFKYWADNQPSGSGKCAVASLGYRGTWSPDTCTSQWPFFCYRDVKLEYRIKIRLASGSSLDPRDPGMNGTVLLQIRQKLQQCGLTEDSRVTWIEQRNGQALQETGK